MIVGLWRQDTMVWQVFYVVSGAVLLVYTVAMAVLFGNTAKRRRNHCNQYY